MTGPGATNVVGRADGWRRNHQILLMSIFVAQFGFYLANPFIPLFVRELGVVELSTAALWSGVLVGSSALVSTFFTPILGAVAERFGDRRTVIGMIGSFTVLLLLMAFVGDVRQLLVLRLLNGAVAGLSPVVVAMTVAVAPATEIAYVVGSVNAVQFLPLAVSPAIGGAIAAAFGIRSTFVAAAICCSAALLLVLFLFRDSSAGRRGAAAAVSGAATWSTLRKPGLFLLLASVLIVQFGEVSWSPILPLRLSQLTSAASDARTATGLFYTLGALAYGSGAWAAGRWSHGQRYLPIALGVTCLGFLVAGMANSLSSLAAARVVVGMFGGVAMTLGYGEAVRRVGARASKAEISLIGGSAMLGRAASPFIAGAAGQVAIVAVFFIDAVAYLLCLVPMLVSRRGRDR